MGSSSSGGGGGGNSSPAPKPRTKINIKNVNKPKPKPAEEQYSRPMPTPAPKPTPVPKAVRDSGSKSYAEATQKVRTEKVLAERAEREESRALEINPAAYVTSGKDESKSIVRSTSGKGVIAGRSGQQAVEQARQEELDRIYDTPEKKREAAIIDLETRKRQALPGMLGVISRINIDNQLKALKEGGATPQFSATTSGGFTTTGVTPASERSDATPNIATIGYRTDAEAKRAGARQAEATQPVAGGESSPAPSVTLAGSTPSEAARRRLLAQSQKSAARRRFIT